MKVIIVVAFRVFVSTVLSRHADCGTAQVGIAHLLMASDKRSRVGQRSDGAWTTTNKTDGLSCPVLYRSLLNFSCSSLSPRLMPFHYYASHACYSFCRRRRRRAEAAGDRSDQKQRYRVAWLPRCCPPHLSRWRQGNSCWSRSPESKSRGWLRMTPASYPRKTPV